MCVCVWRIASVVLDWISSSFSRVLNNESGGVLTIMALLSSADGTGKTRVQTFRLCHASDFLRTLHAHALHA